jgi:hypothetical protein
MSGELDDKISFIERFDKCRNEIGADGDGID